MSLQNLFGLVLLGSLVAACGTGGSGGNGGSGGTGGSGGQTGCASPADCEAPPGECDVATCDDSGACGVAAAPDGTQAKTQAPGDCRKNVCQAGAVVAQNDDADTPDKSGDCTVDTCNAGAPETTPEPLGTPCSDAGGKVCDAMGQCVGCNTSADCTDAATPACDAASSMCVALSCMDGEKNGDETDIDCGGSCAPCDDAKACLVAADCKSGVCEAGVCQAPTCTDAVKNGAETDADCGGAECPKCGPEQGCNSDDDCGGAECSGVGGTCTPNCMDQVKNNDESDVDCGGAACSKCEVGQLCDVDASCVATAFCDMGVCAPKKDLAAACAGDSQCTSGFCVDAVCCSSACANMCVRCDLPPDPGNCLVIYGAVDPDDECDGNGGTDVCNGNSGCGKATGSPCATADECGSGYCTDGFCCDAFCGELCQACSAAKTGAADGQCANVPANTDPDSECTASLTCNGNGGCSPKLPVATPCTVGAECQSGHCYDGVCCGTICTGLCRACNLAATVGACTLIPAGTDPANECAGASTCNGAGACQ